MEADGKRTMAVIMAEIMNQGPFLPRSVRRDYRKYRDKKGRLHTYEVQSRVNVRLGDRRVPKEMFDQVRKLTDNYRRFKKGAQGRLPGALRSASEHHPHPRLHARVPVCRHPVQGP